MNPQGTAEAALPREVRQWAAACHLMALSGLLANGIGFLLGPLVIWLLKREDHPFIDRQGKEAVNFQITMIIALIVSAFLCLIVIGFGLLIIVGLLMIIFPLVAGIRANEGTDYRYPFSFRFLK